MEKNIVFLISLPRAGSTLLQKVLANHSKIYSAPEPWSLLMFSIMNSQNVYACSNFSVKALKEAHYDFYSNFSEKNQDIYEKNVKVFIENIYFTLMQEKKNNAMYFLDKTPRYYLIVEELAKFFPNAKFVILTRNPLASFISSLETWRNGDLWIGHNFIDYYEGPKHISNAISKFGNDKRFIQVQYEELVNSQEKTLKELFSFLDMQFEEGVFENYQTSIVEGSMGDPKGINEYSKITNKSVEKWINYIDTPIKQMYFTRYIKSLDERIIANFQIDIDEMLSLIRMREVSYMSLNNFKDVYNLFKSTLYRKIGGKCLFKRNQPITME